MATSALTRGLDIPPVACGCAQEQNATQGRYLLADVAGTYVPATLTINYEDAVYTEDVVYTDEWEASSSRTWTERGISRVTMRTTTWPRS